MGDYSYLDNASPAYIEDLYHQYRIDPDSVEHQWKKFFDGYEFAIDQDSEAMSSNKEVAVAKLINAYRSRGHLIAETNPIKERRKHKADLVLDYFGLSEADLDTEFDAGKEINIGRATLGQILLHLKRTYCASMGVEFMYCRDEQIRQWLYKEMEPTANHPEFSTDDQKHILKKISEAVMFENFLHTKYIGKKRFSLEGAESLIPALDAAIRQSANMGAEQFILGMAHRGRLNVLANIFNKPYEDIFKEFEGSKLPEDIKGDGDVKYHLGRSADVVTLDDKEVHITLASNPSHLESVNPVVQGMAYAKQEEQYDGDVSKVIPILIHGDAAIAGQGVNYEQSNISKVEGYSVGGTVHIVVNNQMGFTTSFNEARSSVYCTDLAKVTESPVFHVNADNPEAVVHAVQMAIKIRMLFNIDVYVDILGYRRYGHNEGDEPRFTQPQFYKSVDTHQNVQDIFAETLLKYNRIGQEDYDGIKTDIKTELMAHYERVKGKSSELTLDFLRGRWKDIRPSKEKDFDKSITTGAKKTLLDTIASHLYTLPTEIETVRKLKRIFTAREKLYTQEKSADWALAELLAYGSLLTEGYSVRISGQDAQRGTFSHRHAVLKDQNDEKKKYYPLNHIQEGQKEFQIFNSILSEYCVMGFEYGYSLSQPHSLVIWEGQFGDFSNGAQIIIDQYLSSTESKWQRYSGLTLFLPHGYEGQGPEHSSARPERYLQLCAENNMYVVNPTTPANHYHLLRRQVKNPFRIPLIVLTPKSLLRHPKVISPIKDLEKGSFKEIIDDAVVDAKKVKRVVLCTGKIYYELLAEQEESKRNDVAIVRLEQLYPIARPQIAALQKKYAKAKDWVWLQEEPRNMGYASHVLAHIPELNLEVISRKEGASPATANEKTHINSQAALIKAAFNLKKKA